VIPQDFISEWKKAAPWSQNDQVEQDLIICRALVEIFSHPILADNLAFRGGTALFKLHLQPVRYSEDIDLVQVHPGPIGPMLDALQEKLNPWLGNPKRKQSEGRVTLTYRVTSEEGVQLRLKVEINSREHFTVLGSVKRGFSVDSRWFSGSASILTYHLDELLGTKVRALYQRKKGRDLFDLWAAFTTPPCPAGAGDRMFPALFGPGRAQGVPCGVRAESVRETWRSQVHRRYRTTRGCRQWFRSCHGGRIRAQTIGDPDSRRTLEGKSFLCHSFIDKGSGISVNSFKMIIFVEK